MNQQSRSVYFLFVLVVLSSFWSCGCNPPEEASHEIQKEVPLTDLNQRILDDPNDPELYMERARYHKRNADYTSAFNDLDRVLSLDSANSEYLTERGSLLYTVGRVGEAKFALERAISLDDQNTDAKLIMAEIFFVLTNHPRSITLINDALKIDDQLSKAYFLKGLIYKEQGNVSLTKSSLQTVTELDPDNVEAFNLLGMEYAAEGDGLALQYYETALSVDSTNREVLYNRAYYYQDQLMASEALWAYDELLRHHPSSAIAFYNKGYVYLGLLSEPEQAVNAFTEAIRLNPEYYQAYNNRGVALEGLGKINQADADYRKTLELSPNFKPAIEGLNRIH